MCPKLPGVCQGQDSPPSLLGPTRQSLSPDGPAPSLHPACTPEAPAGCLSLIFFSGTQGALTLVLNVLGIWSHWGSLGELGASRTTGWGS